ncbi:Lpp/OprI family alanine-zipper lipoprotein [Pseudogulbenkiania sp. MAI-1]|uniref:Lpp/OprI family alanine-zipper lipoprotein n=1 Tax=Pseudogulbenkiania sp. MAI-1 TaxID=990370 RepID=UPI00045EAF93|nr:Lpp/OprI family alanine-zipper lipoprotein [Pseudogulbenkiania sp. MAI-1]
MSRLHPVRASLLASLLGASLLVLGGCASSGDVDKLRADVTRAQQTADQAMKAAAAAQATADQANQKADKAMAATTEATQKADQANQTANQANQTANDANQRLDRMFKKTMMK